MVCLVLWLILLFEPVIGVGHKVLLLWRKVFFNQKKGKDKDNFKYLLQNQNIQKS